ncbi:M23 family metallopeptidase [Sphingobium indicum]|uniref:Peptidase n=2 Tax=Sphingobium indicum TaxID=332055 RepID=A0A1L5BSR2_SPHIB|nr:M23 family metallopeptidase [Sphingobium indicum]APL95914.1 peptidase [Sphingobium indicum B90A]KEY98091.1 peptidase [Sphingomonas sp. BHC-A]NYI22665.1 murein DD-endopeptidase MepM/ murein hydrolase activator NlpD [Sphingobium indicum]RYM02361.1 M23 family metallopeptidase [Sphingobium indicum]
MKGWIAAAALATIAMAAEAPPPAQLMLTGAPVQGGVLLGTAPKGIVELRLDGQLVPVDADGRFLIAFDRDAQPQAWLTGRLADGTPLDRALAVAPRDWRIEQVNAPLRPTKSTEAFLALRKPELERIAAARNVVTDAQGWRQRFIWPRIGRISGLFGSQRVYQGQPGAYHGGVDIAGAPGEPVVAPADGVVILAADRPFTLEGNLLMIDHGHGLNSAFLHLSRIDVIPGQHVVQGQRIGAIGATGRATGPHLHWGMKWNDARIDPLLLAGPMPQS